MKTRLLFGAAIVAAFAFSGCTNEEAKLAGDIAGTWKGETMSMAKMHKDKKHNHAKECPEMSCTPTITFERATGTNGGDVTINGDFTMSRGVDSADAAAPVKATVNGTVKATGTWSVKDGDEIDVTLNPATVEISVDTASLSLSYASLTDAPVDALDAMKANIAANISDVLKPMLAKRIASIHEFDDVKVTGNNMVMEIHDRKVNFTKE